MSGGLYQDLVEAVKSGNAMIVVGTGVSISATGGHATASWRGLLRSGLARAQAIDPCLSDKWAARVRDDIDSDDLVDLLSAAEKISRKLGAPKGGEYSEWLRKSYEDVAVIDRSVPEAIAALNLPILTTNYDDVLQSVVEGPPVTWRQAKSLQRMLRGDYKSVGHLHGHYRDSESVVLGIRSYEAALASPALQALERAISMMTTLIFVGMGDGLDDPNFSALFEFVRTSIPDSEYRHYRLCEDSELTKLSEKHRGDSIYPVSFGDEKSELGPFLRKLGEDSGRVPVVAASELSSAPKTKKGRSGKSTRPSKPLEVDPLAPSPQVRVALGVIRDSSSQSVVLVQRRHTEATLEWGFPAGFVNPTQDPKAAIQREVQQETGLACKPSRLIGDRVHPLTNMHCLYFEMTILHGELENGDREENLDVRWVRIERLYDYIDREDIYEPVRKFLGSDDSR